MVLLSFFLCEHKRLLSTHPLREEGKEAAWQVFRPLKDGLRRDGRLMVGRRDSSIDHSLASAGIASRGQHHVTREGGCFLLQCAEAAEEPNQGIHPRASLGRWRRSCRPGYEGMSPYPVSACCLLPYAWSQKVGADHSLRRALCTKCLTYQSDTVRTTSSSKTRNVMPILQLARLRSPA